MFINLKRNRLMSFISTEKIHSFSKYTQKLIIQTTINCLSLSRWIHTSNSIFGIAFTAVIKSAVKMEYFIVVYRIWASNSCRFRMELLLCVYLLWTSWRKKMISSSKSISYIQIQILRASKNQQQQQCTITLFLDCSK